MTGRKKYPEFDSRDYQVSELDRQGKVASPDLIR
jgi:hypothetical protein